MIHFHWLLAIYRRMLRHSVVRAMMQLHAQPTPDPLCHSSAIFSATHEKFVRDGTCCEVAYRGLAQIHPLLGELFDQYGQEVMSMYIVPRQVSISVYWNVD